MRRLRTPSGQTHFQGSRLKILAKIIRQNRW